MNRRRDDVDDAYDAWRDKQGAIESAVGRSYKPGADEIKCCYCGYPPTDHVVDMQLCPGWFEREARRKLGLPTYGTRLTWVPAEVGGWSSNDEASNEFSGVLGRDLTEAEMELYRSWSQGVQHGEVILEDSDFIYVELVEPFDKISRLAAYPHGTSFGEYWDRVRASPDRDDAPVKLQPSRYVRGRLVAINGVEALEVDGGLEYYVVHNGVLCNVSKMYFDPVLRKERGPQGWCRWTVDPDGPSRENRPDYDGVARAYFHDNGVEMWPAYSKKVDGALLRDPEPLKTATKEVTDVDTR